MLGCGTSSGVPRTGNDWGACDPHEPRNRRTRASIIVESDTTRILVDDSPDLREKLLAADIIDIDAILWNQYNAERCYGKIGREECKEIRSKDILHKGVRGH